jgi:Ca2+-transporting ATPase
MPRRVLSKSTSTVDLDELLIYHETNLSTGLTSSQVSAKRSEFGYNELDKEDPTPLWKLVLEQFDDTLVKILLAAAAVSFALGKPQMC